MRRTIVTVILLGAASLVDAQQVQNVKYLTSLTPTQLRRTMSFISASLGVNCSFCHVKTNDQFDFPSDEKKEKKIARNMIRMVIDTNSRYFEDRPAVTCNTCHRGGQSPVALPYLPQQQQPDLTRATQAPLPSRDEVLARYAKALGSPDPDAYSTRTLQGILEGRNGKVGPIRVAESSDSLRVDATSTTVLTPNGGWTRDEKGIHELTASELEQLRELHEAFRPLLPDDVPSTARVVQRVDLKVPGEAAFVVEYPTAPTVRQQLYFNSRTGLLMRRVTLTETPIAEIPIQTDFLDYKAVGTTRFPFTIKVDSIDPRIGATRKYTEVKLGSQPSADIFKMPGK